MTGTGLQTGYRPQSADTSIEADQFLFAQLRQKPLQWRLERFRTFNLGVKKLCLTAAQQQFPERSPRWEYARRTLGAEWLDKLPLAGGDVVIQDPITFAQKVAGILETLNIPYYIGGSVASSLQGESRYTEDLDLVIEIAQTQAESLIAAFTAANFYISGSAVEDAIARHSSSFNVIDNDALEKADIFVLEQTPFARSKMERRIRFATLDDSFVWLASAEDIILQKLVWGRSSDSQKQWRDVLGVLKVQNETLDFEYLAHWGNQLGIAEALTQAFEEAGV